MAGIYDQERRKLASAEIAATAQRILSGELSIVAGARRLSRLRFDVGAEHDSDFVFFVGVDSETDHLPVGDARSQWNSDALKAKDNELKTYEASVRDETARVCQRLIQRYETHAA